MTPIQKYINATIAFLAAMGICLILNAMEQISGYSWVEAAVFFLMCEHFYAAMTRGMK